MHLSRGDLCCRCWVLCIGRFVLCLGWIYCHGCQCVLVVLLLISFGHGIVVVSSCSALPVWFCFHMWYFSFSFLFFWAICGGAVSGVLFSALSCIKRAGPRLLPILLFSFSFSMPTPRGDTLTDNSVDDVVVVVICVNLICFSFSFCSSMMLVTILTKDPLSC